MYRMTHFEISPATPIKSMVFYNQVFGWTFKPSANNRKWIAITGSKEHQVLGNPFQKKATTAQSLTNAIEVKDVDAVLSMIQQEGGEVIVPKMAIPGIGWLAYFKDLEQNVFGVMQSDKKAK